MGYGKRKAFYENEEISDTVLESIFDAYTASGKWIGSFKDYYLLLANSRLSDISNSKILDFIKVVERTETGDTVPDMVMAYIENPTADRNVINELKKSYNKIDDKARVIGAMSKNPNFSDSEIKSELSDAIYSSTYDKELTVMKIFNSIMKNNHIPPRNQMVEQIWDIIISRNGYSRQCNSNADIYCETVTKFFTRGTQHSYNQSNSLDINLLSEKAVLYFKKFGIIDWILDIDKLSPEDQMSIWKSEKMKDITVDENSLYGSRTVPEKMKASLLHNHKEIFGKMYYDQTGDTSYLSDDVKDVFLF